jgi:hypothetical protein
MSRIRIAFAVAVLISSSTLSAKDISGGLTDTVTDRSGASVPNATVTIINTERNQVLCTLRTGFSGTYVAPGLPIDSYSVSAALPVFRRAVRSGITLIVNDRRPVNSALELEPLTEQVTVEESPAAVELQTEAAANLISGTQIRELSLNNRNAEQLVTLMPRVSSGASDQISIRTTNPLEQRTR